jgi:sulfur carrier protein ThiS
MSDMITIDFLNAEGGGFAEPVEVHRGSTVEGVVNRRLGSCRGLTLRVNGEIVERNYVLQDGDSLEAVNEGGEEARSCIATDGNGERITFINNDGGGFGDRVDVQHGTTIEEFCEEMMPDVDLNERRISVNGRVVRAGYVLQNGDRVAATPLKIEGGAGTISILLVRNDGAGRAERITVRENITIGEFFRQQVRGGRGGPENYIIRINNATVTEDDIIRNNDKVTITPRKIAGGR